MLEIYAIKFDNYCAMYLAVYVTLNNISSNRNATLLLPLMFLESLYSNYYIVFWVWFC